MKNPMSKFNLLSYIRFFQKDKKNNREINHETKILKKMLAIALVCILMVMSMGAYGGDVTQYSNLSQLAWYFRELNYHDPETGGVFSGDVDESMINFVNSYYPGVFSSAFIYTPIDNGHDYIEVHIDDLKRLVNQGYPSILTLVEHPTYDEHAVVVAGYSTYLGNWVYIQDGWTNNQVMILYNTSGQSAARTYHNLNYLYYK